MRNPSLQEQLQALVPNSVPVDKKNHSKAPAQKPAARKPAAFKPAWLEYAYYGIELLKAHYPECFKEPGEIKPLKIGIKQDLVKQLSTREDIVIADKSCMIKSLSYYVTTLNYFKSVVEGESRLDLNGQPAGQVTAEEARYSSEQYQAKL
ncbi:MAG TPA: ProQ/FINO family protein, partial [Gammaproteobacteria bacterium]|nr:ProQ/FINO family protein [Gammaproteobacteria bacterium]